MSRNEPHYQQAAQYPEDIPFTPISKKPHQTVRPVEQNLLPHDEVPHISHSRSIGTILREWQWEIATWLLGSCALAGIIGLLVFYRDRSLKDWTLEISLATVVAALSQVAQSALLFAVSSCIGQLKWDWLRAKRSASDLDKFEEASRGPKGSFILLFKTGLHLVSIGALATVLLLAFSPFTQQSNTIRVRNVDRTDASSSAVISRSVQYANPNWDNSLVPRERKFLFNTSVTPVQTYHPHMYRAVLSGVLDEKKSISDIAGNCTAEACKWHNYTTLALCAAVKDISSSVQLRKDSKGINRFRLSGASWEPPAQSTTTVPDTFWMAAPFNDSSKVVNERLPPISDIYVAYFPSCNEQKKSWGDLNQWLKERDTASNWKAFKGTISLCLQTLDSTFNNTMETKIVNTQNDLAWKSSTGINTGKVCLAQSYQGEDFCVGEIDLQQWSSAITETWAGAAMLEAGDDNYYTGPWVPEVVEDIMGPVPTVCDPNIGPGYGFEGFTRRMNNIAIAMSNAMRTGNTTSPDSFVHGSEWISEQYFVVEFHWISLPAAVYLLITFFLVTTIIKSRKEDVPLWKSSPLVLFHVAERNNGMQYLNQVEQESKHTQVQLKYTGENWHLQNVTGKPT